MVIAEIFALISAHKLALEAVSRRNFRKGINIVRHAVDELPPDRINVSFDGRIFRNFGQHRQSLYEHADALQKSRIVAPMINRRKSRA